MADSPTEIETKEQPPASQQTTAAETVNEAGSGGGGWGGGWGFSAFSVLSDLQKAATKAVDEISRNASEVAKTAAKSIADMQNLDEDSESFKGEEVEKSEHENENEDDNHKLRKSALDKLEKASEDSLTSLRYVQGLKALDNSVENLTTGAWQALSSAWKGGSNLVQKLEHSAANLAESIQHGGLPRSPDSVAPSLIEVYFFLPSKLFLLHDLKLLKTKLCHNYCLRFTGFLQTGKAFTERGIQVLEFVGKETMDLLITETGIEVEKDFKKSEGEDEDQLLEEVTFDRCFYIYGGPEQLEELEALSNHYALLFNRRKAKLSSEQKSDYDGKLKEVLKILSLSTDIDGSSLESDKGKKIATLTEGSGDEIKNLHDSSLTKAADMAAGFTNTLAGLAANDIIQRTASRLESLHSEGVHRLSEMCCFAVSQLLILGKSIISNANEVQNEDADDSILSIDWPEDSLEKAKLIRLKAHSMTVNVDSVSNGFITGISDVAEAYQVALKGATADSQEILAWSSVQDKANSFSEHLRANCTTAVDKIQEGLQYLSFVVLSTSMPYS
ncbi:hypothetical protein RJ641_019359 [Dillenia turbinata]|uniref:DUF7798 domain-containing protein n=1 Tax=Dillenia turbinata TaxID=194707 RepID=A0AAN8UV72_9MAGN